jgi:hypothetical protein
MGLERTGRIARIIVDPKNADAVFACALGHAYGPQPERGVYKTVDGGRTWNRVLFVDENTGCSDVAMDPNNPRGLRRHVAAGVIRGGEPTVVPQRHSSRSTAAGRKRLSGKGLPEPPAQDRRRWRAATPTASLIETRRHAVTTGEAQADRVAKRDGSET